MLRNLFRLSEITRELTSAGETRGHDARDLTLQRQLLFRLRQLASKRFEKRRAQSFEFSLETFGAVALAASPGFGAVEVAAAVTVVRVLHVSQLEVLLPIGSLFEQRTGTVTNLNPAGRAVIAKPGFLHVAQVFAFRNRTFTKRLILNAG